MKRARAPRAPLALVAVASVVAAVFALPLVWLVRRNVELGSDVGDVLTSARTLQPLLRSLALAVTVAIAAAVLGTGLAWLVARTDLPGRRLWRIAGALPLVVPSYVGAAALLASVSDGGLVAEALAPLGVDRLPELRGFSGAVLVLSLLSYPYVYLPVLARLGSLPASLEESARLLGRRPSGVFTSIVLPQIAPAIAAGALLVALYTVSDFGAVSLMRYDTLTRGIYETRLFDQPTSVALGLVLAAVALTLVLAERAVLRGVPRTDATRTRVPHRVPLGRWRPVALGGVVALVGLALVGPVAVLGWWAARGWRNDAFTVAGASDGLARPVLTTVTAGMAAAAVTVVIVLPVAYLTARYRSRVGGVANAVVVGAFALPGLVIALSLTLFTLEASVVAGLYQTTTLLILAYSVHFGGQALRASQVAVSGVPARMVDAARVLGAGRARRLLTVEAPLMAPGLAAGAGLVLLSTMKELPATLLLSPPGFETLATVIWNATETGALARAGTASLVLVAASAVLTWLLVIRNVEAL